MTNVRRLIFAGFLLAMAAFVRAETPTINSRLPLQQDGPVTASPWFTSVQPAMSGAKNHYINSTPPLFYYGFYGYCDFSYGYGFGWNAPFYSGSRNVTIINNYAPTRR